MAGVAVIVPVLNRPGRVGPLLTSLYASAEPAHELRPVFVCSAGDTAEIMAVCQAGHEPLILERPGRREYARKINLAVEATSEEWLFTGADDLAFEPGWLDEALAVHADTGALVIGTNDLANPTVIRGMHATHSLVHRDYVRQGTIDEPGKLLCELYDHNSVDVEFTQTAIARGVWAFAQRSHVRHLHPIFDRSVKRDATYQKGLRGAVADRRLLDARRHLWDPSAPRVRQVRPAAARATGRPRVWAARRP